MMTVREMSARREEARATTATNREALASGTRRLLNRSPTTSLKDFGKALARGKTRRLSETASADPEDATIVIEPADVEFATTEARSETELAVTAVTVKPTPTTAGAMCDTP